MSSRSAPSRPRAGALLIGVLAAAVIVGACEGMPGFGPALVHGMQLCIGVPDDMCREEVRKLQQQGRGGLAAWRITCDERPGCTPRRGSAIVEAMFGDGSTDRYGFGWEVTEPMPAP